MQKAKKKNVNYMISMGIGAKWQFISPGWGYENRNWAKTMIYNNNCQLTGFITGLDLLDRHGWLPLK